jgi:hypothetical protein
MIFKDFFLNQKANWAGFSNLFQNMILLFSEKREKKVRTAQHYMEHVYTHTYDVTNNYK